MTRAPATAKINLALVVGPLRPDGKHELATVYQRVALADRVQLEPSDRLAVDVVHVKASAVCALPRTRLRDSLRRNRRSRRSEVPSRYSSGR